MSSSFQHTAVITGASRGIGAAIASELIKNGWTTYNLDIIPPAKSTDTHWVKADLANPDAIAKAFNRILADGPVTGLINNAGLPGNELLEDTSYLDFDRTVAINQRGPMLCAQAVLPSMKSPRFGRIVNISSRAHLGKTKCTAYAATKGALISMTRVWALEMAKFGITVNALAPGPIRTDLFDAVNPPDDPRTREIIDTIPVGRLGVPRDVAHTAAFLMAKDSSFITGQTLYVCGGATLARGGS